MAELALNAQVRKDGGKGVARKLRAAGQVPAILYGRGVDPTPLTVDARALMHLFATDAGTNILVDLTVEGAMHLTLPREITRDPVRGTILHIDFFKVSRDQTVRVTVPVHIEGDARGVKEGGILEQHLSSIEVECKPHDVPERVHVDVSALGVGDSIHVRDLTPPSEVVFLSNEDDLVVACAAPQALKLEAELEVVAPVVEGAVGEGGAEPSAE